MEVDARATFDDLLASVKADYTAVCRASAAMLDKITALEDVEDWDRADETSLSCYLGEELGVASQTASEWVRVARALRELPAVRRAYERGDISWDKLRALTRFAKAEDDERLAREVPGTRLSLLWLEARRHERARKEEFEEDRRLRYLRMDWDEDRRFLRLYGELPAEQGAAVEAALERRAQEVVLEEGPVYDRQGARLADALAELVTSPGDRPAPATMVVHASAEVVAGVPTRTPSLAETETGIQLSDEAVRRLACDARVEWVAEAEGRIVGIGRQGRVVPGWMSRLLRHRDRECRFPGCHRTRWLHAHHLVHWADGGPTNLENVALLCGNHHRLVHDAEMRPSGHPSGELSFRHPGERTYKDWPMVRPRGPTGALVPMRN